MSLFTSQMFSGHGALKLLDALGVGLLHSLWQITLIAVLFWLSSTLLKQARTRHWLGMLSLVAAVAWPAATMLDHLPSLTASNGGQVATLNSAGADQAAASRSSALAGGLATRATVNQELSSKVRFGLALAWSVGFLLMLLRLCLGIRQLHQIATTASQRQNNAATAAMQLRLQKLARRLGYAESGQLRIRVRIVQEAIGPCTFGLFRATIIVPTSALTGLSPDHLDAVLLHELAHLQRKDPWAATAQAVLDCALFFHPAARWISRSTQLAREQACDDAVISTNKARTEYAEALLRLAETQHTMPALAARGSQLRRRITRILQLEPQNSSPLALTFGAAAGLALGLFSAAFAATITAPQSAQPPQQIEAGQILLSAEVAYIDRSVLADHGITLSPSSSPDIEAAVIKQQQTSAFENATTALIASPRILGLVGSNVAFSIGIAPPALIDTSGIPEDIADANRLHVELDPKITVGGAVVSKVQIRRVPRYGRPELLPNEKGLEAELANLTWHQQNRVLLVLRNTDPKQQSLGILLSTRFAEHTTPTTPRGLEPVTLTVRDADLEEVIKVLARILDLAPVVEPSARPLVDAPLTMTAVQVPAEGVLRAVLELNCLEPSFSAKEFSVLPLAGCLSD